MAKGKPGLRSEQENLRLYRAKLIASNVSEKEAHLRPIRVGCFPVIRVSIDSRGPVSRTHPSVPTGNLELHENMELVCRPSASSLGCLALVVDTALPSRKVVRELRAIIAKRGAPERIRMDNGSELSSRHFMGMSS